jgi:hypothetical protein
MVAAAQSQSTRKSLRHSGSIAARTEPWKSKTEETSLGTSTSRSTDPEPPTPDDPPQSRIVPPTRPPLVHSLFSNEEAQWLDSCEDGAVEVEDGRDQPGDVNEGRERSELSVVENRSTDPEPPTPDDPPQSRIVPPTRPPLVHSSSRPLDVDVRRISGKLIWLSVTANVDWVAVGEGIVSQAAQDAEDKYAKERALQEADAAREGETRTEEDLTSTSAASRGN